MTWSAYLLLSILLLYVNVMSSPHSVLRLGHLPKSHHMTLLGCFAADTKVDGDDDNFNPVS